MEILKVPKMLQKVLQSIRKPRLAILEELKAIKTLNQQKIQNIAYVWLPIRALLEH